MKFAFAIGFLLFGLTSHNLFATLAFLQNRLTDSNEVIADEVADEEDFVFETGGEEDPNLPRYLCIGDSISSNYSKAIIDLHAGKINAHHPPTNCRSSEHGRDNIVHWLGDFRKPGKQWDVISFNFGHWDDDQTKANYQGNLRAIIERLKQTKAKLIWVTTCPVPEGYPASELSPGDEQAPGRKSDVVRDLLNPWALEVMREFPEITICDQWQFVYENRHGRYKDWWRGNDIHFSEGPAYAIGRLLAHHVLERIGEYRPAGFVRSSTPAEIVVTIDKDQAYVSPSYPETKVGELYSEAATLSALPERWKTATRFHAGFPKDFRFKMALAIPDEHGWEYRLDELPNHLRLRAIKEKRKLGFGLAYYDVDPELVNQNEFPDVRLRFGPGVSGDEFLSDVESGNLNREFNNSTLDFADENVAHYYDLYRVTRDRYYSDQITKYASAMMLLSEKQYVKADVSSQADFVWPQVNAARLLLEQIRIDRAGTKDQRLDTAKKMILGASEILNLTLASDYISPFVVSESKQVSPFVPGRNTLWLVQQRRVPERSAQLIEYRSWRETIRFFAVLTAAVRSLEELQGIEGSTGYVESIASYRRVIAAGLELFQRENDCVELNGVPFLFHSTFPMQDRPRSARLKHPMFAGDSLANARRISSDLTYIWEANATFGCSTGLIGGYANSIVHQLEHPTAQLNGRIYPRQQLDSPWYIAATAKSGEPAVVLAEDLLFLTPLAPELLNAQRQWSPQRKRNEEVQLLKAMAIYGEWKRRIDRAKK